MLHLTHYFKFEYVLIDDLCIMRDSRDDWAMEAQVMHKICENSECTLSLDESNTDNVIRALGLTIRWFVKARLGAVTAPTTVTGAPSWS